MKSLLSPKASSDFLLEHCIDMIYYSKRTN